MRPRRRAVAVLAVAVVLATAACTGGDGSDGDGDGDPAARTGASSPAPTTDDVGPRAAFVTATPGRPNVADGDDWTLPTWTRPARNSGFFSEEASPTDRVLVRSADQSWRQLAPARGRLATDRTGRAQGMTFASLDDQLAEPGPFWMRVFASGTDWAPAWVARTCRVKGYGPDDDGQRHLPIWDECVWRELLATYRTLFVDRGLRADPRLRFVYVPGAFTWAEFDYDVIEAAVGSGDLDWATYLRWYAHAWKDLAALFGPYAHKLVFTGEDYPFADVPGAGRLARQAVDAGLGIRTGITELSNFHLSEAPAYGSRIGRDGHLTVDESLPVQDGTRVLATENECYDDCGYDTDDVGYAIVASNLKALQLRMNWVYVVPGPSYLARYRDHWDWLRLSLGQRAATAPDAWAALRDAEDTFWRGDPRPPFATRDAWPTRPYVRNLERWLVQRDVPGDGVARRSGADVRRNVLEADNGTAYEGLSTDVARGQRSLYLDLDRRFTGGRPCSVVVKVTYLDRGRGPWRLEWAGGAATVARTGTGRWRTATVAVADGRFDDALPGRTDLRVTVPAGDDLDVRFVRVVRVAAP